MAPAIRNQACDTRRRARLGRVGGAQGSPTNSGGNRFAPSLPSALPTVASQSVGQRRRRRRVTERYRHQGLANACEIASSRCSLATATLGVVQRLETAENAVYTIAEMGEWPGFEAGFQGCVRRAGRETGR